MNILLLYPTYTDTFWSFKHALPFVNKKAAYPPLGLLTIAAMLPKEWKQRLIDTNVKPLKESDIAWADMVLISGMIIQKDDAQRLIDRCKSKGKTIVAGGPMFTTQHEQFRNVDHFVLGEAETTLPLFLADLARGSPKSVYASQERPDITTTPIPLWDLVNIHDYTSLPVQYSRGCPFNCEFCDIVIMNGRIPRTKTPQQIIQELDAIYARGWRGSVFFVDDNFIGNKQEVKRLMPQLIRWQKRKRFPFSFITEASVNLADDHALMDIMVKANFAMVFLGIETPELESLKSAGKFQNLKQDLVMAVQNIHKHGLQVMGGFIVGFDTDTENIFERQFQFIQKTGIVVAMVGVLTALPQTRLWLRLQKEGRLLKDSLGDNTLAHLNFTPKLGTEKLLKGYADLLDSIYSPKNYYRRINTFLKAYDPKVRNYVRMPEIKALFKSMWRIGLRRRHRWHFWKSFATYSFRPKKLSKFIQMSIFGVHFEQVAKKNIRQIMNRHTA